MSVDSPASASGDAAASTNDEKYKTLLNRITLGLVDWLKKQPNICSVKVSDYEKVPKNAINLWEQQNMCMLPEDVKNFYNTVNGFQLTWAVNDMTSGVLPVGKMNINPINQLNRLAGHYDAAEFSISLGDLDSDEELLPYDKRPRKPKFNEKSRIYELDSIESYGKVCLVYKNTRPEVPAGPNPEIWFLDRALSWHYLASDFSAYFRLMVMHLGLPEWHFLFTKIGLSNRAKQWFYYFCPTRLAVATAEKDSQDAIFDTPAVQCKFDVSRVIKGKSRKAPSTTQKAVKKPSTGSISTTPQNKTTTSRISSAQKKT